MTEEIANEKSHLRCKIILEVLGKPKEHVKQAIKGYVDKIKEDSDLILLNADFSEVEEKDEGLWATFVELEIVIKGLRALVAFCFDYMPSSVQILKPREFSLKGDAIEDFINNLQAKLHQVDMVVKQLRNENHFVKQNMHVAIKNVILVSLASGSMNKDELEKITGIKREEMEIFLKKLEEENMIQRENEIYSLAKKE